MLTLMLLRHAKAGDPEAGEKDIDRKLTRRGKRAAQAMGRYLAANGLTPDMVLCSPSRRTQETWRLAALEMPSQLPAIVDPALYAFGDGGALLDNLVRHAGKTATVLIVGHNPSIQELALRLSATGDKKLRARLKTKYPTGALATITFEFDNWSSAVQGGVLTGFVRPRDLIA